MKRSKRYQWRKNQDIDFKFEENVKLLELTLDYKLNCDSHISNLSKKVATQLDVLNQLRSFLGFKEKEMLVQCFVYSDFNYCPLDWSFSTAKSFQIV